MLDNSIEIINVNPNFIDWFLYIVKFTIYADLEFISKLILIQQIITGKPGRVIRSYYRI